MRKILLTIISCFCVLTISAQNSEEKTGALTYCLPQTELNLKVEIVKTYFFAGPYAQYAAKYLGIQVRQNDDITAEISKIQIRPVLLADQSQRYVLNPSVKKHDFLQLTKQGLICTGDGQIAKESWKFASVPTSDFADRGVSSNLTSQSTTLYQNVNKENSYNKLAIEQKMIVEKSLEERAKEAADMILSLRKKRVQIVTGDTDASFNGEAMGAALKEISKLEKEYMSLFVGYSTKETEEKSFDILPNPDKKKQIYIAFRLSQKQGLVAQDDISAKPYMLTIEKEKINPAVSNSSSRGDKVYYRIPALCELRISDGINILCKTELPIYQLGIVSSFSVDD